MPNTGPMATNGNTPIQIASQDVKLGRLRQMIAVAGAIGRLDWRRPRRHVRAVKVEELLHVRLERIALVQAWQVEARLYELEHGRKVHRRVRDIMRFGERRDYDGRNAKARDGEVAWGIAGIKVLWRDSIGIDSVHRRDVIVKAATFVEGQEKDAILPGGTIH
jgi:hypothetical protein